MLADRNRLGLVPQLAKVYDERLMEHGQEGRADGVRGGAHPGAAGDQPDPLR
jgi:hypothetical protein